MINQFSAVSFVGFNFNVYFCHVVYSYGKMKRIIKCKSYAVSNNIRICKKASQDASDNLDMSTEATNAELNEAIMDEFGVKYSKDGRKLLKAPQNLDSTYSIKEGDKDYL